eukprot:ANDGO_02049.mRNA.1 hypothetical protein
MTSTKSVHSEFVFLSPNEIASQIAKETHDRRVARLLQVRERERVLAQLRRRAAMEKREKDAEKENVEFELNFKRQNQQRIAELQSKKQVLKNRFGEAHRNAQKELESQTDAAIRDAQTMQLHQTVYVERAKEAVGEVYESQIAMQEASAERVDRLSIVREIEDHRAKKAAMKQRVDQADAIRRKAMERAALMRANALRDVELDGGGSRHVRVIRHSKATPPPPLPFVPPVDPAVEKERQRKIRERESIAYDRISAEKQKGIFQNELQDLLKSDRLNALSKVEKSRKRREFARNAKAATERFEELFLHGTSAAEEDEKEEDGSSTHASSVGARKRTAEAAAKSSQRLVVAQPTTSATDELGADLLGRDARKQTDATGSATLRSPRPLRPVLPELDTESEEEDGGEGKEEEEDESAEMAEEDEEDSTYSPSPSRSSEQSYSIDSSEVMHSSSELLSNVSSRKGQSPASHSPASNMRFASRPSTPGDIPTSPSDQSPLSSPSADSELESPSLGTELHGRGSAHDRLGGRLGHLLDDRSVWSESSEKLSQGSSLVPHSLHSASSASGSLHPSPAVSVSSPSPSTSRSDLESFSLLSDVPPFRSGASASIHTGIRQPRRAIARQEKTASVSSKSSSNSSFHRPLISFEMDSSSSESRTSGQSSKPASPSSEMESFDLTLDRQSVLSSPASSPQSSEVQSFSLDSISPSPRIRKSHSRGADKIPDSTPSYTPSTSDVESLVQERLLEDDHLETVPFGPRSGAFSEKAEFEGTAAREVGGSSKDRLPGAFSEATELAFSLQVQREPANSPERQAHQLLNALSAFRREMSVLTSEAESTRSSIDSGLWVTGVSSRPAGAREHPTSDLSADDSISTLSSGHLPDHSTSSSPGQHSLSDDDDDDDVDDDGTDINASI